VRKLLVTTVIAIVALILVAPRFVRWTTQHANTPRGTAALRLAVLQRTFVDSSTVADSNDVTAVVMDWNMGAGITATLVAFADGKTSLYVSPGKVLTSEGRETIREAAEHFRAVVASKADQFSTTADFDPPAKGKTRFYIITRTGTFATYPDLTIILENERQTLHPLLEAGQTAAAAMQQPAG
jgi:hypothetical protein